MTVKRRDDRVLQVGRPDDGYTLPEVDALAVLAQHGHTNPDCSCNHPRSDHSPSCAARDSYGLPCGCPSFELSQVGREWAEQWADGEL